MTSNKGAAWFSLDKTDPIRALDLAKSLISKYDVTQCGSASGKFSHDYSQYLFHKSSDVPLIKEFVERVESHLGSLQQEYNRPFHIEWIYLTRTLKPQKEFCIPHKDGYWMDGQIHLTIQGEANIEVWSGGGSPYEDEKAEPELLQMPNGTIWYLNGSNYWHNAKTLEAELPEGRIELLAPVNPHGTEEYHDCLLPGPEKRIDTNCENWKRIKMRHIQLEKEAQQDGSSSSPYNLEYIKGFEE
ncbi:MAG: hypothetical protein AAF202_02970 [Pseudomonadota bacterium]